MAQPLQQVSLNGMGFQGLNTELSPINSTPEFALAADNLVVDEVGRLGAREAFKDLVPAMELGEYTFLDIIALHPWYGGELNPRPVFAYVESEYEPNAVPQKRHRDWSSSIDIKPYDSDLNRPHIYGLGYCENGQMYHASIPNDYDTARLDTALFVNFKEELLLFSANNPPLKYDGAGGFTKLSDMPEYTPPQDADGDVFAPELNGDVCCSAYGRLWVSGVNGDYQTVYYSSLLREEKWYDPDLDAGFNDGGVINVAEYWPVENDYIVNIHAHNGLLIVFGRRSILIYANADKGDPADDATGFGLQDAISNVGLVERDAICNTGTDVLFVDDTGLRALGRVVQEKSNPIALASLNVKTEFIKAVGEERQSTALIRGMRLSYNPARSLAVCLFRTSHTAYAFSTTRPSSTGGLVTTFWTDCNFNCMQGVEDDKTGAFWLGGKESHGLLEYRGYKSERPYVARFESSVVKQTNVGLQKIIPRSIVYMLSSDPLASECHALWGFGAKMKYRRAFKIKVQGTTEWGIAQYAVDEYVGGNRNVWTSKINTMGSGELMRVGLEVEIRGFFIGLQEIAINYSAGRIYA
ncbi:hypothetical protein N9L28_05780 [Luminiphilus sp.]|nr:hypothetical protein [Luminiphilus sp.]